MKDLKERLKHRFIEITGKVPKCEFDYLTEAGFCGACIEKHPDRSDGVICKHCNIIDLIDIYQGSLLF